MKLENGKYTFQVDKSGTLVCLRHGKPWREFVGDKAALALYCYARDLENYIRDDASIPADSHKTLMDRGV